MKKQFFLFGAVAAFALGGALTACSDDALDEGKKKVAEVDQTRYMHVTIANPPSGGSRAEEEPDGPFQAGTALENYVHELYFVFYDAEGLVTGEPVRYNYSDKTTTDPDDTEGNPSPFDPTSPTIGDEDHKDDGNTQIGNDGQNIAKTWNDVIAVNLQQGQSLPAFVCAFINPVDFSQLQDKSLAELDNERRMSGRLSDGHFPMSNSVYYNDNPITGASMVRLTATPILSGQLYNTIEEARTNSALEIYVERYASKVGLTLAPSAIKNPNSNITVTVTNKDNNTTKSKTFNYELVKDYKLTFVPEYWRVNAVDRNSFVIKRYGIPQTSKIGVNYDPAYTDLNKLMGHANWNDPANHRSYWAASPAYYDMTYPSVSDDVTDLARNEADGQLSDTKKNDYGVYYFSYDQIKGISAMDGVVSPSVKYDATKGFGETPFYANETTVASSAWGYKSENKEATPQKSTYNPLAALPSAVIVGHYVVTKNDAPVSLPDGFWLYGKSTLTLTDDTDKELTTNVHQWDLYETKDAIKREMTNLQNVVLKNVGTASNPEYRAVSIKTGTGTELPEAVDANVFNVEHPSQDVREFAGKSVAGRLEALQLTGENLTGLYWYNSKKENADGKDGVYELIKTENLKEVNAALLTTGYATHYGASKEDRTSGLAYFSIPIEHLGMYGFGTGTTYTSDQYKDAATGLYKFENCPPGSFGLVRNHVYNINVSEINGLATALRDGEQPIVPPIDMLTYYISAKLNILNWRIVPTQEVKL